MPGLLHISSKSSGGKRVKLDLGLLLAKSFKSEFVVF